MTASARALGLRKGREELRAGRALVDAGRGTQAVSHAWLAAFHAASGTLVARGTSPATDAGVVSAFNREISRTGGFDPDGGVARSLRRLYEADHTVNRAAIGVPAQRATGLIDQAEAVVEAIAAIGDDDGKR